MYTKAWYNNPTAPAVQPIHDAFYSEYELADVFKKGEVKDFSLFLLFAFIACRVLARTTVAFFSHTRLFASLNRVFPKVLCSG